MFTNESPLAFSITLANDCKNVEEDHQLSKSCSLTIMQDIKLEIPW